MKKVFLSLIMIAAIVASCKNVESSDTATVTTDTIAVKDTVTVK